MTASLWEGPAASLSASRLGIAGFGLARVILLSVNVASYLSIGELRAALASEAYTRRVLTAIHTLETRLTRAEASLRGFLITGDRSHVATYSEASAVVEQTARELKTFPLPWSDAHESRCFRALQLWATEVSLPAAESTAHSRPREA